MGAGEGGVVGVLNENRWNGCILQMFAQLLLSGTSWSFRLHIMTLRRFLALLFRDGRGNQASNSSEHDWLYDN